MALRIISDAGHGGHDPGGASLGLAEKFIVLNTQDLFWKAAADRGHTVLPTRVIDVFVPIPERSRYANEKGGDVFVSFHANAGGPSAVGPWSIHAKPSTRGKALAQAVQRELAAVSGGNPNAAFPDESNWVGNRRLGVLRGTSMPAVLVELGFMTNAQEILRLQDLTYLKAMAEATLRGIEAWAAQ